MKKSITITDDQVTDTLRRLHSKGSMLEYFLAMQGLQVPSLDSNGIRRATEMAEKPPKFKEAVTEEAAEALINLADMHLKMALDEQKREAIFGEEVISDLALSQAIEDISLAVHTVGFSEMIQRMNYDLLGYMIKVIPEIRSREIAEMEKMLELKKSYLLPHILSAKASSKSKYGGYDYAPVEKEIEEFINVFFPQGSLSFFSRAAPIGILRKIVLGWTSEELPIKGPPRDGVAFEYWCATELERMGWTCSVSKASGDQGVDIIASKSGLIVAIQCKRFMTPIGNKAVQEVHAGMKHYNANCAVVLGSGGFTKSARELALTTGVQLIDAENLVSFNELLLS